MMRSRLLKCLLGGVVVLAVSIVLFVLSARPAPEMPYLASLPARPLVMAHQCADQLWPGNTLYACQKAAELGVDVLEMDFQLSADGRLVMIHDDTLDRTTNSVGRVDSLELAELKQLDAAYHWSSDGGQTFPYRGKGLTLATVDELFVSLPGANINIEIKPDTAQASHTLCDLIRYHAMQEKVMVVSFHSGPLAEFRRACPEVATAASQSEVIAFFTLQAIGLGSAYTPASQALQVPETSMGLQVLTPGFVYNAHARNLEVHAWTLNETEDLKRVLALGVDGIMTKRPDRMMALLGRPYTMPAP
jgi:glycerophosphoryl diester phosphodiesterase